MSKSTTTQAAAIDDEMTDREFLDLYGYPASWDDEEPQPRQRPTPSAVAEAMLRDPTGSSDELLFEGLTHD